MSLLFRLIIKYQHSNIVKLRCFSHEFVDIGFQCGQKIGSLHVGISVHESKKTILSVKLIVAICCLRYTVGIKEYSVAGRKRKLTRTVTDTVHTRKNEARSGLEVCKISVCLLQQRRIMSCVCELKPSRFEIQNTHPSGNEHIRLVVFTKLFVCLRENLVDGDPALRQILDDRFRRHHEHCRGNTLARNVCGKKRNLGIAELIEIVLSAQAKVLRALQEQKISRVGSDKDVAVDVRVVAATNKDIRAEIERGNFREDLYHRLSVILIKVPPLRDRKGDIEELISHFIEKIAQEHNSTAKPIDEAAVKMLGAKPWTGNIRELRNVVERLMILSGERITQRDVELYC